MNILCPNCKQVLQENEKVYKCANNHCFDIAKEGYVNLVIANKKKSKNPGDNIDMVRARQDFLLGGYYEPLSEEINKIINDHKGMNILDAGACEGYYTHRLDKHLMYPHKIVGLDISKDSIKYASRKDDNCFYLVASAVELPVEDNSIDVIINNFAPHSEEEFLRVLRPGGIVIKITPAPNHLLGLKQKLFDNVSIKESSKKFETINLAKEYTLEYEISVDGENIFNLLKMTPFYYKSSLSDHEKLKTLDSLTTKVAFDIRIYKK